MNPNPLPTHPDVDVQSLIETNQALLKENRLLRSELAGRRKKLQYPKKPPEAESYRQLTLFDLLAI